MKHRSVIAFVFVAAALFSLPQLSHDLQALKGAAGARLHRELLHTFLSLPAGDPVAAAQVARPAETMLASCTQQERASAPAARSGRAEAARGAEGRGRSPEQSAMINDPAYSPIKQLARVEVREAADQLIATLPEGKVETEVAMIVPPEGLTGALALPEVARIEADKLRIDADGLRVAYATAARSQASSAEWQKANGEAFRKLEGTLPGGTFEFRFVRDGLKAKALRLKCNECPAGAPRVTRLPRQVAVNVTLPAPAAPAAPAEWLSE